MGVTWNWLPSLEGSDGSEIPEALGDGTLAASEALVVTWNEVLPGGKHEGYLVANVTKQQGGHETTTTVCEPLPYLATQHIQVT